MKWGSYPDETGLVVMLRSALRIDDVDQLRLSPTERISVVWVDLSERPDLAALAARNVPEPSEVESSWFSGNAGTRKMLVGLRIAMTEPTAAVFTLVFPLERFAGHLLTIAKFGRLWIVPGPPLPHPIGTRAGDAQTFIAHVSKYTGQGVLIELDPHLVAELRVQLDRWRCTQ